MKKEKWWGTILLLLIIMFSFITKDDITKDTVYVTNTNMTFEIENLTKKINIERLNRKTLNELVDMIYIIDKNNIKIEFKNI